MTTDSDLPEQECGGSEPYPAQAPADEQRRAYILQSVGAAAAEMDTQTLCQMIVDLAEMLRTGAVPSKTRRLRPVP